MTFRFAYNLLRIRVSSKIVKVRLQGLTCFHLPKMYAGVCDKSGLIVPACASQQLLTKFSRVMVKRSRSIHHEDEQIEDVDYKVDNIEKSFDILNASFKSIGRVSRRNVETALRHITSGNRLHYGVYFLMLIRCCGKKMYEDPVEDRIEVLNKVWNTFVKTGVPISLELYNALLQAYNDNGYKFSAEEKIKEMSEYEAKEPNYKTYNKFVLRYSEDGEIDEVNKILEMMKERDIAIGKETFDALILAHTRAGDMQSVYETLDMMSSFDYPPDTRTYFNIMNGLATKGDLNDLKRTFDECLNKRIEFSDRELLEIFHTLAVNKNDKFMPKIIEKLRKGVGYHRECINAILQLICCDRNDAAYMLMKTMHIPVSITGGKTGQGIFFIKQLIKMGISSERLCFYCEQLVSDDLHPFAYEISIRLLLQYSDENASQAIGILRRMNETGIEVRDHYFWPILCSANEAKDKDTFFEALKLVSEWKMINVFTMRRFGLDLMFPVTDNELLIEELQELGVDFPTLISSFVEHYLYQRDPKAAADLCIRHNVPIDSYCQTNLINCLCDKNCTKEAVTILRCMLDQSYFTATKKFTPFTRYSALKFIKGFVKTSKINRIEVQRPLVDLLQEMKIKEIGLPEYAIDEIGYSVGIDMSEKIHSLTVELIELRRANKSKA